MTTTQDLIVKGNQISAGNYIVSIGLFNVTDVAIYSKSSGKCVPIKRGNKQTKKFKSIKRKFKHYLCSSRSFYFCHMRPDMTVDLINILKNK